MKIIKPLLILAVAAFAACSYTREITEDHSAIADPRERWRAYEIHDYEFTANNYRGDSLTGSYLYHVEYDRGKWYRDLLRGKTYGKSNYSSGGGTDFDHLFRNIPNRNADGIIRYNVEYDARFGYPRVVDVEEVHKRTDERGRERIDTTRINYRVTDFVPLDLDY